MGILLLFAVEGQRFLQHTLQNFVLFLDSKRLVPFILRIKIQSHGKYRAKGHQKDDDKYQPLLADLQLKIPVLHPIPGYGVLPDHPVVIQDRAHQGVVALALGNDIHPFSLGVIQNGLESTDRIIMGNSLFNGIVLRPSRTVFPQIIRDRIEISVMQVYFSQIQIDSVCITGVVRFDPVAELPGLVKPFKSDQITCIIPYVMDFQAFVGFGRTDTRLEILPGRIRL